ncbi:MAG: PD40 domain-containing protein [Verrucomicrobia bacterium]|nr:PD40 domain-containing protein [Verrucomicrobiota bacterium]
MLVGCLVALWTVAASAQQEININRAGGVHLIPISMSGFTGEVESTLRFDLEVAGFRFVGAETAQYQLTGNNGEGSVEGFVTDRISRQTKLAKKFTGGSRRRLAHALSDAIVLALTGQPGIAETKIAFRIEANGGAEIYVADYDGHNAQPVTRDHSLAAAPCWVPGHRILYYTSYRLGNPDIYSQDLQTGERRVVARYSGLNTSPAVSPDGSRLAMILSKAGSPDVYVSDRAGGHLLQLTHTHEDESSPCWSPDGGTLCFTSRISGRAALYVESAAGGAMRRLRTEGAINTTEPDWSPDGRTIAFTAQMGGFQICTVPARGGEVTVLVGGEDPSWAPNSRTLIFTRRVGHRAILSLLDVPTKRVKDIAQVTSGEVSEASWAR